MNISMAIELHHALNHLQDRTLTDPSVWRLLTERRRGYRRTSPSSPWDKIDSKRGEYVRLLHEYNDAVDRFYTLRSQATDPAELRAVMDDTSRLRDEIDRAVLDLLLYVNHLDRITAAGGGIE